MIRKLPTLQQPLSDLKCLARSNTAPSLPPARLCLNGSPRGAVVGDTGVVVDVAVAVVATRATVDMVATVATVAPVATVAT
eukprot:10911482-Alexandrium_andersonii.AAC.1